MLRRQLLTADEHARLFGVPSDPETLIRHDTLSPVDLDWLGVSLESGRLHVAPVTATTSEAAKALDRTLDGLLPRVRITELLRDVDARTGFVSRSRDLRTGRAHDRPSVILVAVLADATNLGLERMANASPGITHAQLA